MPKITGHDMIATHESALRALAAKRADKIAGTCANESDVLAAHFALHSASCRFSYVTVLHEHINSQ